MFQSYLRSDSDLLSILSRYVVPYSFNPTLGLILTIDSHLNHPFLPAPFQSYLRSDSDQQELLHLPPCASFLSILP